MRLTILLILLTGYLIFFWATSSEVNSDGVTIVDGADIVEVPPPPWAVYEERMANGEIWYAYATRVIRQYEVVEVGMEVELINAKGERFLAKIIKIFQPTPASGPRSPSRVWIEFENLSPKRSQPSFGPAVIFKKWGWP